MAVAFTSTGRTNYQRLGPTFYFFDAHDGRFIYEDNPYQDSAGRQFTRSLYPLHSGQIAGPIGVLVVLILGLATAEMCISGAYVWWKKRRIRVAARRTARGAKNRVERDPTAGSGFG